MEILGQPWWVQGIGLTISLTGLYFWATGMYRLGEQYREFVEAIIESKKLS
jgi:hypothetical protein